MSGGRGERGRPAERAALIRHLRRLAEEGVWGLAAERVGRGGATATGRGSLTRHAAAGPSAAPAADRRPAERGSRAAMAADRSAGSPPRGGTLFGGVADGDPGGGGPPWDSGETLAQIEREALACTACRLSSGRTKVVFGVGAADARLMFIGEGPGRDEDLQGEPFVGRAGRLLDRIIDAMGLRREQVYIANTVKCRPPDNRNPEPDELAACRHFLMRQIAVVRPTVIVLLGRVAAQALLDTRAPLGKLRGRFHDWHGIDVMCTYHPAYLLRNPADKRKTWEDIQLVMRRLQERA